MIAERLNQNADEITIRINKSRGVASDENVQKQELAYMVRFSINQIMAGGKMMGISDEKNRGWYEIKGSVILF